MASNRSTDFFSALVAVDLFGDGRATYESLVALSMDLGRLSTLSSAPRDDPSDKDTANVRAKAQPNLIRQVRVMTCLWFVFVPNSLSARLRPAIRLGSASRRAAGLKRK